MSEKWESYYERTRNLPPHRPTIDAISLIEKFRETSGMKALDLGCGAGRDTRYLLSKGMIVTAVDANSHGVEALATEFSNEVLTAVVSRFDEFTFDEYDFVTSQYALPFNPPESFYDLVKSMKDSLLQGGCLSVNIFGDRDGWSSNAQMTFLSDSEVRKIFEDLTIIKIEETEKDSNLADGTPKHWHYFDVLVTK